MKKFKPVKKDKDGKVPKAATMKDEELNKALDRVNPERDEPHPTLGIKHKYIDLMRKYGGMDDPRRVKKEEKEDAKEEKKDEKKEEKKEEKLIMVDSFEYPSPEERGPIPETAHPRSEYDGIVDNDYHKV